MAAEKISLTYYRRISVPRNQKFGFTKTRRLAVEKANARLLMTMRTRQPLQSSGLTERSLMEMSWRFNWHNEVQVRLGRRRDQAGEWKNLEGLDLEIEEVFKRNLFKIWIFYMHKLIRSRRRQRPSQFWIWPCITQSVWPWPKGRRPISWRRLGLLRHVVAILLLFKHFFTLK